MDILSEICKFLEEDGKTVDGQPLIDETPIMEFQQNVKNMRMNLSAILEEGRVLRLGIVGEVKAGKSSFLNAILFDGEEVLPKAPTPMTAALTRISYSTTPTAKIVFYSQDDWRGIEKMARQYDEKLDTMYQAYCVKFHEEESKKTAGTASGLAIRGQQKSEQAPGTRERSLGQMKSREEFQRLRAKELPADLAACKEVYDMAHGQGIDISSCLGQEKMIEKKGSGNNYLDLLSDYVGSSGRYTPIVKYTEIQLDNPMLKGVEVTDTPGLNDPVISRSRTTQNFLTQCDAVFLLSYCGQFLGAEDIEFIMSTLPNEGIKKAVLVGSKFDSAILQYANKKATFRQAYLGTKSNCEEQAKKNINDCRRSARNTKVIEQLERSLPPLCTSSMAFSAAIKRQKGQPLNPEESHLIQLLTKRFPDFREEHLMGLSSITDARYKAFDETIAQKEQIIQERKQDFLATQKTRFLSDLEEIYARTSSSKMDLENFDCAQDEDQLKQMRNRLNSVRIEVKGIFEQTATDAQWTIKDIVQESLDEMNNHLNIEVASQTKTEHHSSTSGHLFWKHTDHWDEIITTHTAEVRDAEANMRKYYDSCLKMINAGFRHMINIDGTDGLKNRIKASVMKAFEQHDQNFDEQRILVPLDTALRKITLHDVSLTLNKYNEMLDGKLSGIVSGGVVKNEDIPQLKRAQDQVLSVMAEDIQKLVEQQGRDIANRMTEQAGIFVDSIVSELEGNHKRLENQIKDKKENLKKYVNLLHKLREAKKALYEADLEALLGNAQ